MRQSKTLVLVAMLVVGAGSGVQAQLNGHLPTWDGLQQMLPVSHLGGGDYKAADAKLACPNGCRCPVCLSRDMWLSTDALLMWGKGRFIPAMATTSPSTTPLAQAGVIGQPGTQIIFGNGDVGNRATGGLRMDFGRWLDGRNLALGASIIGVRGDPTNFGQASTGIPILARPFFNVPLGAEDAQLIAYPGQTEGNLGVTTSSDMLGVDGYLRTNMLVGRGYSIDGLGGYQFNRLDDDLRIESFNRVTGGGLAFPIGSTIDVVDFFDAHNEFHGGMVGVLADFYYCNWKLTVLGKLGLGNMNQEVFISGRTITDTGGGPAATNSGLLTQTSNIGSYGRSKFAFIPEMAVTMTYELESWFDVNVGYHAIYWSDVVQAGEAVDRNVDPTQVNPRPAFVFEDTDYWVHGLRLGGTVRW